MQRALEENEGERENGSFFVRIWQQTFLSFLVFCVLGSEVHLSWRPERVHTHPRIPGCRWIHVSICVRLRAPEVQSVRTYTFRSFFVVLSSASDILLCLHACLRVICGQSVHAELSLSTHHEHEERDGVGRREKKKITMVVIVINVPACSCAHQDGYVDGYTCMHVYFQVYVHFASNVPRVFLS